LGEALLELVIVIIQLDECPDALGKYTRETGMLAAHKCWPLTTAWSIDRREYSLGIVQPGRGIEKNRPTEK
jgi:hypothetical protein